MAQTLTCLLNHIVFSTKNRDPLIAEDIEPDLFAYIGGICRGLDSPLLAAGGYVDHVHLLISQSKNISLSELMLPIKRDSSRWIKSKGSKYAEFRWQDGYFGFTIGYSQIPALSAYIASQKERHRTVSFQDEMRKFLRKYRVEYDERYVWD